MTDTILSFDGRAAAQRRERAFDGLAITFLTDSVTIRLADLSASEALLVMAINQANIAPLTRNPRARRRYGSLEAPAPDGERRPVSVNAIAGSLGLPFETVRRQVRRLESVGACALADGGVIVPETFLADPRYLQSVVTAHERLLRFYFELRSSGLLGRLPPSAYPSEPQVPVRAAARLLSDYLLRASEGTMALAGDVISALVLLGVLDAALESARPDRGASVAGLARRLRLPAETVRRHAADLIERGRCVRGPGGLQIPAEVLASPPMARFLRENRANVRRLFAGLAERGVVEAWDRLSGRVRAAG